MVNNIMLNHAKNTFRDPWLHIEKLIKNINRFSITNKMQDAFEWFYKKKSERIRIQADSIDGTGSPAGGILATSLATLNGFAVGAIASKVGIMCYICHTM